MSNAARYDRRTALAGAVFVVLVGATMGSLTHEERLASGEVTPLERDPRLATWSAAAALISERPLTGYGFGRGMLHEQLVRATGIPMLWHSHNLFIDSALQTGLPGLILLLALLGATVLIGCRLAVSRADGAVACGVALIAVVAGMAIRNTTDVLWVRNAALAYWSVVGVLMAWGRKNNNAPSEGG